MDLCITLSPDKMLLFFPSRMTFVVVKCPTNSYSHMEMEPWLKVSSKA